MSCRALMSRRVSQNQPRHRHSASYSVEWRRLSEMRDYVIACSLTCGWRRFVSTRSSSEHISAVQAAVSCWRRWPKQLDVAGVSCLLFSTPYVSTGMKLHRITGEDCALGPDPGPGCGAG